MLRITGGTHARRRLKAPTGLETRPTADRVKEALFNILGPDVQDMRALDLFAGSGALGLEALSRGAISCLFVEQNPKAAAVLKQNIASLDLAASCRVLTASFRSVLGRLPAMGPFGLILGDPPYDQGHIAEITALAAGLLAPDGVMVLEHSPKERPLPQGNLVLSDRRVYGQTELSFITPAPSPEGN